MLYQKNMKIQKELVSIITPAYKAEQTITETITSVQAQTYKNWEMLIVDDGSPDKTGSIVKSLANTDIRIRPIHQKNSGPAMARQTALDHAKGRFIAFLDSDDYWLPEKLERQLLFLRRENAAISYTAYRRIQSDGSNNGHMIHIPNKLTYRDLLVNTAIATSTVMIDRQLSGDFKMRKTYYDDFVLWLEILKRGHIALGLNEDLMRYRIVKNSVSRNKINSALMVWKTYREIENMSVYSSFYYFTRYVINALYKYRTF